MSAEKFSRTLSIQAAQRQVPSVVAGHATILGKLMADKDQQKAKRVMETMLQMDKLDIEPLQRAYEES